MEASKGGRHQIGILAGFILEQVAGFILECMAGFVGIRMSITARRMFLAFFLPKNAKKNPYRLGSARFRQTRLRVALPDR